MQAKKKTFMTRLFSTPDKTITSNVKNGKNYDSQTLKEFSQHHLETYLNNTLSQQNSFLEALTEPALITSREGLPRSANLAYLSLCQLASLPINMRPPFIDRLFSYNDVSKIFYKLLRAALEGISESVILPPVMIGKKLPCQYKVEVSPLGQKHVLWRLYEQEEAKIHSLIDYFGLQNLSFGIFEVNQLGNISNVNQALLDWLNVKTLKKEMRIEDLFGKHASLLQTEMNFDEHNQQIHQFTLPCLQNLDCEVEITLSYFVYQNYIKRITGFVFPKHKSHIIKQISSSGADFITEIFTQGPVGLARLQGKEIENAHIIQLNDTLSEMTQKNAKIGAPFKSIFVNDDPYRKNHQSLFKLDGITEEPYECCLAGEIPHVTNVYVLPLKNDHYLALFIDISTQKHLEEQLFQSQKMQVVGQLAGGVAHDFNNLLTVMRLNCDELLGRHPLGDPSYSELKTINQTVARAAGLVRKLLAFSRKQTLRSSVLDIGEVLSDFSILIKQILQENIKFEIIHGRNLPKIKADKGQLETALMNLVTNARDAMLGQKENRLVIETNIANPEQVKGYGEEVLPEGEFVHIKISDTGIGIEEETLKKIFEPFYTTKEIGKGTGLGLSTVYGIVKQTGGYLFVDSQIGKGTSFSIFLPVYKKEDDDINHADLEVEKEKKENYNPLDLSGKGLILLVEDEDAVRTIAAKTLRKRGYEVLEAEDGEKAIEMIAEYKGKIDLMISDVVMPGMDGPKLLEMARENLGNARIIFISGYAEEEFSETLSSEASISFLPKPFTLAQLAEKVKEKLSE